jgi:hypothetical protein
VGVSVGELGGGEDGPDTETGESPFWKSWTSICLTFVC